MPDLFPFFFPWSRTFRPRRPSDLSMRLARGLLGIPLALLLGAAPTVGAHGTVRFDGGVWFDGQRFVPGTKVSRDGVLSDSPPGDPAETVVDLRGLWIVPPLADAHTHALADSPDPAVDIATFVRAGILFAKNPNSMWEGMERGRRALAAAQPPVLFAVHAGSGFTSPEGHPAQIYGPHLPAGSGPDGWVPVQSTADLDSAWSRLLEAKPDFVKVYLETSEEHARRKDAPEFAGHRGLDPALVPEVVRRARAAGLAVSAHVRTAADFRVAVASGVDEINHLPLEAISAEDAGACAEHGVTVVTTVLSHRSTEGVYDPNALHRDNLRLLRDAGVQLALGTDNMHVDVVDELLAVAALDVFDAPSLVRLATTESIRAVLRTKSHDVDASPAGTRTKSHDADASPAGTLANGADATFLALRRNPLADPSAFREIAQRFVRGHLVPEPTVVPPKPSLADALGGVAMHEGVDAAIARYGEWRRDRPDDFDFAEPQLNALGYALLKHGRAADAVRIFALNAEQYPASPNAWDSLGEAQLAAGDPEAAARSAERVLAILPAAHGYPAAAKASLEATARKRLGG